MMSQDWMANLGVDGTEEPDDMGDPHAQTAPLPYSQRSPRAPHLTAAPTADRELSAASVQIDPPRRWPRSEGSLDGQPVPVGVQVGTTLSPELLGRRVKPIPRSGWRRVVHRCTFGAINPGENPADVRERAITYRLNAPVASDHRITVFTTKGGAGKSTTTLGLGSAFADARTDRVLAIDANPDKGILGQRLNTIVPTDQASTIYDLLAAGQYARYSDVRAHTLEADTGLQVVASHADPARSEALTGEQYQQAAQMIAAHFQVILSDCGTGITHDAMRGVYADTDSLIVPTLISDDSLSNAVFVLDWLDAHSMRNLSARAIVVINQASGRRKPTPDEQRIITYFQSRVRAVVTVPFDPHLAEGGLFYWDRLRPKTVDAYRNLASLVADDFHTKREGAL
ncbi:hypothetical protein BFL43_07735 [Williamsia sp. 1135]|nr:hypothetical protein BFL43_07735 [Williamsia sp. 1135]